MKKSRNVSVYAAWIAVIAMIIIILGFSSQNGGGSVSASERIVDRIISFLNLDNFFAKNEVLMENRNYIFRKTMHFTEYFILAMLAFNVLRFASLSKTKSSILAMLITCLTAVADELYQMTVPGRNSQILDVFIDTAGALAAVLTCLLVFRKKMDKRTDV